MAEMSAFSRWSMRRGARRRAVKLLDTVQPQLSLPPSARLLELGAGSGGLSVLLHERFPSARLTATDYDPRQVEEVERSFRHRFSSIPSGVEVRALDARQLSFADGSFDAIFAVMMLHHVEAAHFDYQARPAVLREIRRVIAPGGFLVYLDFSRTEEMDRTLGELGLLRVFEKRRWPRTELAVFRAPGAPS